MHEQLELSSAEKNNSKISESKKYFISYRRRADLDSTLATYLVEKLRNEGSEVFIDIEMHVGIEWSKEIENRIAWADYMVVLLSAESIRSEMVLAEVRRALKREENAGSPKILPIRVNFKGTLGYELDGYIGKYQYLYWKGENDNQKIVENLLKASSSDYTEGFDNTYEKLNNIDEDSSLRPESKADMRQLKELIETPGGRLSHDSSLYIHRPADLDITEKANSKTAQTIIIKGPHQMGKSSLLLRYLDLSHQSNKKVVLIDLLTFGSLSKISFSDFANQFVDTIIMELGLNKKSNREFERALDLTYFMEDEVLLNFDNQIVLAIDEADRLIDCEWKEEFYSVLRTWDSFRSLSRKRDKWGKLHLALVIATNPRMLIEDANTSPFNTTIPITLDYFNRSSLNEINDSFGQLLNQEELDSLYEFLGGHPYLTPLAFYRILKKEFTFSELMKEGSTEFGPFGEHLRSIFDGIHSAKLIDAVTEILYRKSPPNNDRRYIYRLEAAGLFSQKSGDIVPSNKIYEEFFKAIL